MRFAPATWVIQNYDHNGGLHNQPEENWITVSLRMTFRDLMEHLQGRQFGYIEGRIRNINSGYTCLITDIRNPLAMRTPLFEKY